MKLVFVRQQNHWPVQMTNVLNTAAQPVLKKAAALRPTRRIAPTALRLVMTAAAEQNANVVSLASTR